MDPEGAQLGNAPLRKQIVGEKGEMLHQNPSLRNKNPVITAIFMAQS